VQSYRITRTDSHTHTHTHTHTPTLSTSKTGAPFTDAKFCAASGEFGATKISQCVCDAGFVKVPGKDDKDFACALRDACSEETNPCCPDPKKPCQSICTPDYETGNFR
jgi:hypothetical protein